ncbi:MAG: hypothetical protein WC758_02520 [Candidatus Woesearchaeota archaeon]|jgi:hypothetical protein
MLNNIRKLTWPINAFKLLYAQKKVVKDATRVLNDYVHVNHSNLEVECEKWLAQKRNRGAMVLTKTITETICDLENIDFNSKEKELSYFIAAAARMADDVTDDEMFSSIKINVLTNYDKQMTKFPELNLFYAINQKLITDLSSTFINEHKVIINKYNEAQRDGSKLFNSNSKEEVKDIRERQGGYSALILYFLTARNQKDILEEFKGVYAPLEALPKSKLQALYNCGAWLIRLDDLWDIEEDKREGRKQLASEGLTNWKQFREESEYVFKGLKQFYSSQKIDKMEAQFELVTNPLVVKLFS